MVRRATWRRRWQRAHAQQEERAGPATRVGHTGGQGRRRAVPLHAAWKRDTVLSRHWTFAGQRRRSRGRGSVRQRPRRIPQPRAGSVLPEQDQQVRGFPRVCGSASFWSTGCGRCCGCWSLRQMESQLGQRCPPSLLEGRRQAQRVLGSHSVQGLGYWSRQDSDVVPLPVGARNARKSCGEACAGRELFHSKSTAASEYEAQLLRQPPASMTT